MITLAYRLFLDPLPISPHWLWLMPPLVLAVSVVYKTLKVESLADAPKESIKLAAQIAAVLTITASVCWMISRWS